MASPIIVQVPGHSYPIRIEEGLLAKVGPEMGDLLSNRKIFVVSDTTVWKFWGRKLLKALQPHSPPVILVPPGERHKRLSTVEKIASQLCDHGAERSSLLLVFGGGVIGDMGAFTASIYLRGIDHVQIPTTLLAQVDSSIGGKTGTNLVRGKNLLGTFSQPRMVLSDPLVLRTLPKRQLRAGLFEAIKCAVIGDPELFDFLSRERNSILKGRPAALKVVIRACTALKGRVVSLDEKEGDVRRILNFGHTFGHALEAATHYRRFLHGEAVGWGMLAATRLALQAGHLPAGEAELIADLIVSYGPVPSLQKISLPSIGNHLVVDKKVRDGKLHFVLPQRVGEVRVVAGVSQQEALRVLEELQQTSPFRHSALFRAAHPQGKS